jgi:hypothetical protein
MNTQKSERAARLATLESFFKLAAENPEVDFSQQQDDEEEIDPIRNIEPDADEEMKGKRNLFEISW